MSNAKVRHRRRRRAHKRAHWDTVRESIHASVEKLIARGWRK